MLIIILNNIIDWTYILTSIYCGCLSYGQNDLTGHFPSCPRMSSDLVTFFAHQPVTFVYRYFRTTKGGHFRKHDIRSMYAICMYVSTFAQFQTKLIGHTKYAMHWFEDIHILYLKARIRFNRRKNITHTLKHFNNIIN